jgi:hypothetical protein
MFCLIIRGTSLSGNRQGLALAEVECAAIPGVLQAGTH